MEENTTFKNYTAFAQFYKKNWDLNKYGIRVYFQGKEFFAKEYKNSKICILTDPTNHENICFAGPKHLIPIITNVKEI